MKERNNLENLHGDEMIIYSTTTEQTGM